MSQIDTLERQLQQLSERQAVIDQLLGHVTNPERRAELEVEKVLVSEEVNTAHRQLNYATRGYRLA